MTSTANRDVELEILEQIHLAGGASIIIVWNCLLEIQAFDSLLVRSSLPVQFPISGNIVAKLLGG